MKNNLKVERARQNITQEELAQKLNVSRQSINAIETGKYIPSTVLALKIARYFKLTVNDIFELDKND
jgi:putative transcriptional regulator